MLEIRWRESNNLLTFAVDLRESKHESRSILYSSAAVNDGRREYLTMSESGRHGKKTELFFGLLTKNGSCSMRNLLNTNCPRTYVGQPAVAFERLHHCFIHQLCSDSYVGWSRMRMLGDHNDNVAYYIIMVSKQHIRLRAKTRKVPGCLTIS